MAQAFEWDQGLFSSDTGKFDRALFQLRRNAAIPAANPPLLSNLARDLRNKAEIPRREFDRRFRLIVSTVIEHDPGAIRAIATHLGEMCPEALNAVRTLLPAEMRHLAIRIRNMSDRPSATVDPRPEVPEANAATACNTSEQLSDSEYRAVVLIGTTEEHVRNEGMLRNADLDPLRLPSLEHLWDIAPTGLCGFVVGGSAWGRVPQADQRRAVRRVCEYSTFIFARVCLDGLAHDIAQMFVEDAAAARCGLLDGKKFCHGQDYDLTLADIQVLLSIAQLLERAGNADFFPLGLSESDASLVRLIAAERSQAALTIRKLGTRELTGGHSAARVFLCTDGRIQPFVTKVDDAEELVEELGRYQRWIQEWEPSVTTPTFHAHQGSAAISYRLQAAPDGNGQPAPTLEDCLESLRSAEWNSPLEETMSKASDLFQATGRAVDRLVRLNSRPSAESRADEFWLHWPIEQLAARGVDTAILNRDSETTVQLSAVVTRAMASLQPHLMRGVIHGDIHGRNILLLDRIPAFIDFRWSGPGHPLVDLVRLDATVRAIAMRMVLPKQAMFQAFEAIYVEGRAAEQILSEHSALAASPLTALAVRVAAKTRQAALHVANAHSLGKPDYFAMTCVVSAHVLCMRTPGSGIERLLLSVLAPLCNGPH